MPSKTEGSRLNDVLKWEQNNRFSRALLTVLSGAVLVILEVIARVLSATPTTGTADGGNTGDGTCTAVTAGVGIQLGTYVLEAIAALVGAITTPVTGTADGGNTGDGTCTAVAAGASAKLGTYVLEAIAILIGAITTPVTGTADGGNTGDGTCTAVTAGANAEVGTYTLECIEAVANAGNFKVTAPSGDALPDATVAVAYVNAQLNFTLNDGAADFIVGDKFTILASAADGNSATFSVLAPDGTELPDATVAVAYVNAQINFTLNDGAVDYIVGDKFTILASAADGDSGTFSVLAPDGNTLPDATVAVAYTNDQLNFTLNDGATDYIVGDKFTIVVAAGSGKAVPIDFSAVDGSQKAAGFMVAAVDAALADTVGLAIVRDAIIVVDDLVWPAGATADQKAAALLEMDALGMVARDAA